MSKEDNIKIWLELFENDIREIAAKEKEKEDAEAQRMMKWFKLITWFIIIAMLCFSIAACILAIVSLTESKSHIAIIYALVSLGPTMVWILCLFALKKEKARYALKKQNETSEGQDEISNNK